MNFFLNGSHSFKTRVRGLWGGYFSFRYLNTNKLSDNKKYDAVLNYSFNKWRNPISPLFNKQSKFVELFEAADKSKFISASLIAVDISEVSSNIDSYREGYPFTTAYAKFNRLLKSKEYYTKNIDGYYLEEVENCFQQLEKYCEVYNAMYLMASFAEEVRLFLNRSYLNPKKLSLKHVFNFNRYDTEERLHKELLVLLDNYKKILDDLKEYPLWREKFENDVIKLFAFTNTVFDTPEIYQLVDQQQIFK